MLGVVNMKDGVVLVDHPGGLAGINLRHEADLDELIRVLIELKNYEIRRRAKTVEENAKTNP